MTTRAGARTEGDDGSHLILRDRGSRTYPTTQHPRKTHQGVPGEQDFSNNSSTDSSGNCWQGQE